MRYKIFLSVFLASVVCSLGTLPASARTPEYAAERLPAAPAVTTLAQKEVYSYTVGYKNTGTATWQHNGKKAVTVKTTEPIRREHWFASSYWLDKTTIAKATTVEVKPNESGFFTLVLEAPSVARTFTSKFALFAGQTKIAGTDFNLPITTTKTVASKTKQVVPPATTVAVGSVKQLKTLTLLNGQKIIQSDQALNFETGQTKMFRVGFFNAGERNWRNAAPSLITLELDPATTVDGVVTVEAPASLETALAKPGELGYFSITIKAGAVAGSFQPKFRLVMNADTLVSGTDFTIPITVTAPPPPSLPPPVIITSGPAIVCAAAIDQPANDGNSATGPDDQLQLPTEPGICSPPHEEPTLRVGLTSVQGQLGVTAASPYVIVDTAGTTLLSADANVVSYLAYDPIGKTYSAVGPGPVVSSLLPLKIRTTTEPSIITLVTFNNPVAYDSSKNDNAYRGAVELQWSEHDEKLWAINELKMEDYLRGLAESSNAAPSEYQKALVTAARSYALYHHQTKRKHEARHFDVIATVADQYYRGYNSELRLPNVGVAATATRGQVVTYQGQVAITPYSASSDGTSRAWEDVWGGSSKPWLVRQPIPEDRNRKRFGHAVGLSQLAAADQAKAGKNYVEILKFFYVGTETTQWYK